MSNKVNISGFIPRVSKGAAATAFAAALLVSCVSGDSYLFIPEAGDDGRTRLFDSRAGFDLSPDGTELAYVDETPGEDFALRVYNFDTGQERTLTTRASGGVWSRDGEWIAYMKKEMYGTVWLVRRDGTGDRPLVQFPDGCAPSDWSPDGKKILFRALRPLPGITDIYYYDLETEAPVYVTGTVHGGMAGTSVAWLPSGNRLIINRVEGRESIISVFDLEGRRIKDVYRFTVGSYRANLGAVSPAGDRLLFCISVFSKRGSTRMFGTWIFNLKTGSWEQALYNADPAHIRDDVNRWLPDGRVAFSSRNRAVSGPQYSGIFTAYVR